MNPNMSHWMCSECNYTFQAENPPDTCPSCKKECVFNNITCYIPECGGPGNIDVRLMNEKIAESKEQAN